MPEYRLLLKLLCIDATIFRPYGKRLGDRADWESRVNMNYGITALLVAVFILNWAGILIAPIWLAVLGHWKAIGIGTVSFFVSWMLVVPAVTCGLSFLMPLARRSGNAGNTRGVRLVLLLSDSYVSAVMAVWSVGVLVFFARMADTKTSLVPLMLWSHVVATCPIVWLGRKDEQGGLALIACVACLSYIVVAVMVLVSQSTVGDLCLTFAILMGCGVAFNLFVRFAHGVKPK